MAGDTQPFGYQGVPGTCLWCGRKLAHKMVWADKGDPGAVIVGEEGSRSAWYRKRAEKAGGYQDDSFCGLRCGYQFGRRLAELGNRLVAKQ